MNSLIKFTMAVVTVAALSSSFATTVVPGYADPWLAGMTNGARASSGDIAPAQSPAEVADFPIIPGMRLTFTPSGAVSYGAPHPPEGPEGLISDVCAHADGAENGIATCTAPADALVGVFLGQGLPCLTIAPPPLSFATPETRAYTNLAPVLKQVFYIGDGRTSGGVVQKVLVPPGAARLFLGTMDGSGWYDNFGSFTVGVSSPDLPRLSISSKVSEVDVCWNSVSNDTYRVECSSNLIANIWVLLQGDVSSIGTNICITDKPLLGVSQRFYRVVLTNGIPTP